MSEKHQIRWLLLDLLERAKAVACGENPVAFILEGSPEDLRMLGHHPRS